MTGEINRAKVARFVWQERLLAARVRRLHVRNVRRWLAAIVLVDEEEPGLSVLPCLESDLVEHFARIELADNVLAPRVHEVVVRAGFQGLHESVCNRHRDVEIRDLRGLVLASDEVQDIGVVDAEDAHVCTAPLVVDENPVRNEARRTRDLEVRGPRHIPPNGRHASVHPQGIYHLPDPVARRDLREPLHQRKESLSGERARLRFANVMHESPVQPTVRATSRAARPAPSSNVGVERSQDCGLIWDDIGGVDPRSRTEFQAFLLPV